MEQSLENFEVKLDLPQCKIAEHETESGTIYLHCGQGQYTRKGADDNIDENVQVVAFIMFYRPGSYNLDDAGDVFNASADAFRNMADWIKKVFLQAKILRLLNNAGRQN